MSGHRPEPYAVRELRLLLKHLNERLDGVEDRIAGLAERLGALEKQMPQARQLEYEADLAAADLAASGYDRDPPVGADRHGADCGCPYCYDPSDLDGVS
jgi:hypothetical protein